MARSNQIWASAILGAAIAAIPAALRADSGPPVQPPPPIFASPTPPAEGEAHLGSRAPAATETSAALHEDISEGLPDFFQKPAAPAPKMTSAPAAFGTPLLMDTFVVYESPVLEMKRHQSSFEKAMATGNLYRTVGRKYTNEWTFADLAQQTGWSPTPPPASLAHGPGQVRFQFVVFW
jgi:hypothetical protein